MKVGDDNESDKSSFAEADRVDYASILNPEKYHFSIEKACVRPVLVVSIYSYKLGILCTHVFFFIFCRTYIQYCQTSPKKVCRF